MLHLGRSTSRQALNIVDRPLPKLKQEVRALSAVCMRVDSAQVCWSHRHRVWTHAL